MKSTPENRKAVDAIIDTIRIKTDGILRFFLIGIELVGKPFPDFFIPMIYIKLPCVLRFEFPANQTFCFK